MKICLSPRVEVTSFFQFISIFLSELALYALDVYYNQTYGFGSNSGGYSSNNNYNYANKKSDNSDSTLPLLYKGYPKYKDPFLDTYRAFGGSWTFDKVLEKIFLAREA